MKKECEVGFETTKKEILLIWMLAWGMSEFLKFLGVGSKLDARQWGEHRKFAWPLCLVKVLRATSRSDIVRCHVSSSGFFVMLCVDVFVLRSLKLQNRLCAFCLARLVLPHSCCTLLHLLGKVHPFNFLPKTKNIKTFRNFQKFNNYPCSIHVGIALFISSHEICSFKPEAKPPLQGTHAGDAQVEVQILAEGLDFQQARCFA